MTDNWLEEIEARIPRWGLEEDGTISKAGVIMLRPEDYDRLLAEVRALRAQVAAYKAVVEAVEAYIAARRAAAHVLGPALERMAMKDVADAYAVLLDAALAALDGEG